MKIARDRCPSIVVNKVLFVFGGYNHNGDGFLKDVEMLDLSDFDFSSSSNQQRQFQLLENHPLPQPLRNATLVANGDFIYVIGGSNGDSVKTVYQFNVATYEWLTLRSMNVRRQGAMTVLWEDHLFVFGGWNSSDKYLASAETLRICNHDGRQDPNEKNESSSSWTLVDKANFLPERQALGLAILLEDGQLILAGGRGSGGRLKTCCHHGNLGAIFSNNNNETNTSRGKRGGGGGGGGFTTHSFPPFPGSPYAIISMTQTCLAFVNKERELYLLDMESTLELF